MAASDGSSEATTTQNLTEFTEMFKLPKIAKVMGGDGVQTAPFGSGDFIMFRTLAVDSVSFKFYDTDAGSRREVRVPVDNNFKFHIVQDHDKVYETVSDLLEDCPTRFQVNRDIEDTANLKMGDICHFVKKIRSVKDQNIYLECKNSSGSVIHLHSSRSGNFSAVHDPTSYTLQEIISLGQVSRTLRLSNENMKFAVVRDPNCEGPNEVTQSIPFYGNIKNKDAALSRITGLPLTFKGNIYMQSPELFLLASPQDDLDVRWKIPLDLEVQLTTSQDAEYEEPIKSDLVLHEFVKEFESDFPVVARVGNCDKIQDQFKEYLREGMEVLIHRVERADRLLCSISAKRYCISDNVKGRFRKSLRRYKSLSDLIAANIKNDVTVKMMEDIASDVPEPFSLKAGDVLIIKNFNTTNVNIKLGKKSYGKCEVISCEKILENGAKNKIMLPTDLEASMIQIPKHGEESGFDINTVFSKSLNLPLSVDFLPTSNTGDCSLPSDCDIVIESIVVESLVVVSPLPQAQRGRRQSGLDARLNFCLLVPSRTDINFALVNRLHFPSNYFIFPMRKKWVEIDFENITESDYEHLHRYNDQTYEDYGFGNIFTEDNVKSNSLRKAFKRNKKLHKKGRSATDLKLDKVDIDEVIPDNPRQRIGSDSNLVVHGISRDKESHGDENIYETFEPDKIKQDKAKSGTSLRKKIKRRVSKIF